MDAVQPAAAHAVIDLTRYLARPGDATRVFLRQNPGDSAEAPVRYERRAPNGTFTEGLMAEREVDSVAALLEPTLRARQRRGSLWPEDPNGEGAAFFLEFDPPLIRLPASIDANGGVAQRCELRVFNRDAVEGRGGTVSREIAFEGFEVVEAGGHEYADCVRLKIDTRFRIRWGPQVSATEYVWLAPHVGEVRRVERFSGLAWFVYFTGLQVYDLVDGPAPVTPETQPVRLAAAGALPIQAWSRCAVYLDRVLPRPRVGGLAVELAPPDQGFAVVEARRSPCGKDTRKQ